MWLPYRNVISALGFTHALYYESSRSGSSHLSILCNKVQRSNMETEVVILVEATELGSDADQIVPPDVRRQTKQPFATPHDSTPNTNLT